MSRDVSSGGELRRLHGLVVFDPFDDRPSDFGDRCARPPSWAAPPPQRDAGDRSRRRERRRSSGWWPGLLAVAAIAGGGLALLDRLLR